MELPFRTIFNLLGPLLNPVDLSYQLIGVSNKENLESHARCLKEKNIRKAWIVHNENGYDELTTTSNNLIIEVHNNKISKVKKLNPKELGFTIRKEAELKGGTASENAFIMQRLFEGESGGIRDNVVLNTAVGLLICEKVNNLKEGIDLAKKNIDNQIAYKKMLALTN
jgi:anthranilate phosphoribosyltransferase